MPNIFDLLYDEFCRARLAEMRKQLLLWPRTSIVSEENGESAAATASGMELGSSQERDSHAERGHS